MNLKLSNIQKNVLNMLVDVYENSATYKGINNKNQSFGINPEKVFPAYNNDYTDQDEVNQFNNEIKRLESENLVTLDYIRGISVISKIKLDINAINQIYNLLGRKDINEKRNREVEIYSEYIGIHDIIDSFCCEQIDRLKNYKNAKFVMEDSINILNLLKFILNNKTDIMERELSVAILNDTKKFENNYRSRICNIIEQYGNFEFDIASFEKKKKRKLFWKNIIFLQILHIFF